MGLLKKLKVLWAWMLMMALGGGAASAVNYHLLQRVECLGSENETSLLFLFANELPVYTVLAKKDRKGVILSFQKTRVEKPEWLRSLRNKKLLVKEMDIGVEGDNLRLELTTEEPVNYRVKKKDKGLILVLRKAPSEEASKFKKVGKEWYEKIWVPKISEKAIQIPLTRERYIGRPISVDFQNADIHAVLRLLAQVGGVNIVVSDTVRGRVTLHLQDIPWDQVLDLVLASKGLGMIRVGQVIRVAPLRELLDQARQIQDIKEEEAREEDVAPLETVYFQIKYAKATDVAEQIKKILSDRGDVTAEPRTNQVIVKDVAKVIREVRELIQRIDQPTKQVLIEARIVEVRTSYVRDLGIRWSGAGWRVSEHTFTGFSPSTTFSMEESPITEANKRVNISIDPGAIVDLGVAGNTRLGFTFGRVTRKSALLLDVQLSALQSQGVARIISTPRVLVEDNQDAEIEQGYDIPYLERTSEGTISTAFKKATLRLKVTPHVTPDNRITLEVELEKNNPDFGRQVNGVPSIVTRRAKSRVIVENGETLVIGGIIEKSESRSQNKVPGLAEVPVVGNLFKNSQRNYSNSELLVFITPRIVSSDIKGL